MNLFVSDQTASAPLNPLVWLMVVALVAALLLWVGVEIQALGEQRRKQRVRGSWLASALLIGAGLWWPIQALSQRGPSGAGGAGWDVWALLGLGLSLAAAEMVLEGVRPRRARTRNSRLLMGGMAIVLYTLHGYLASQGSGLGWLQRVQDLIAAAMLQMGVLALLLLPRGGQWPAHAMRSVGALVAVGLPLGSLYVLDAALLPVVAPSLPASLALILLAAVGASFWFALTHLSEAETQSVPELDVTRVDPLTGLSTRLGLEQLLSQAVIECDRNEGALALMMFDLDGFNPVNSSFGHDSGDALLRQAAERLRACVGPEDVCARIGGDEFVVLLRSAEGKEALAAFAQRVLAELARPYVLDQRELALSASAGIARYPLDGGKARILVCADAAKNAAKRLGGACYCFFAPGMDGDTREQLDILNDLRLAIERKELELFYQPKIDARSGQITAAEALLRWHHPSRGMVSPAIFIPVAERFGFMRELGNWVIDDACRQARVWRESGLRMRVAINLSAHQMRQDDLIERIEKALEEYRVHPSLLTCEITESVVMENTQAIQDTFKRLGELGVHLSIDDFGTGYSSLSYLRQLPAKELKVDRAFVTDIVTSVDARAVVDAVVKLAHALGLRVVAEGVETQGQQAILAGMGCDELQGYLFARPMSAQAILLWSSEDKHNAPAFRASLFGETSYTE
ncbi:bifunctional diguanylate cyclase/phosphodiesterase [Paucibacter sp. AS339]|uniref:putative bifunctional diguanylate cyclase/phosphodiesterase n=1 Tax=Paucibacter hankyongi TaxID=3133434 RepID=UPI0030B3B379